MTAHWVVLAAAALTTLVAAAVGAALAVFAGQALPQAVKHDLSAASGTSMAASAPVTGSQAGHVTAALRQAIGGAMPGVPFAFWQASWSDPLGLVPGALPAHPASTGEGNTPLLQAAAMSGVTAHSVLLSGRWPAAGTGAGAKTPIQAALPATAAALLHVSVGDLLRLRDRVSGAPLSFQVTGLFAQRQRCSRRHLLLAAELGRGQRVEHAWRVHHLRAAACDGTNSLPRSPSPAAAGSPSPT